MANGFLWFRYEFEVLDYLKGIGGEKISANVSFGSRGSSSRSERDYYVSHGDAKSAARYFIQRRSGDWDGLDAVIFLKQDSYWMPDCQEGNFASTVSYGFTLSESRQAPEYQIDSAFNRAWLPSVRDNVSSSNGQSASRFRLSSDSTAHTPRDEQYDKRGTISLDELRTEIQVLEDEISRKETMGVEGYVECLDAKYDHERKNSRRGGFWRRDYTALVETLHQTRQNDFCRSTRSGIDSHCRYG